MVKMENRLMPRHTARDDLLSLFEPALYFPFSNTNRQSLRVNRLVYSDRYRYEVDVPGVKRDEIDLAYEDGYIMITANREEKHQSNDGSYYESRYGTMSRTERLPRDVDPDNIKSYHSNGVLTIDVPRKLAKSKKGRSIAIEDR